MSLKEKERYEVLGEAENTDFGGAVLPVSHSPAINFANIDIDGWFRTS